MLLPTLQLLGKLSLTVCLFLSLSLSSILVEISRNGLLGQRMTGRWNKDSRGRALFAILLWRQDPLRLREGWSGDKLGSRSFIFWGRFGRDVSASPPNDLYCHSRTGNKTMNIRHRYTSSRAQLELTAKPVSYTHHTNRTISSQES